MPVTIKIPTPLRKHTDGRRRVEVDALTVGAALDAAIDACPGLRAGLFQSSGELRSDARIFVGEDDVRARDGLDTAVADGDTIAIVPPVAGA
jgi:molybdopterin converting factor small subunit